LAGDAELLKPLRDAGAALDRSLVAAARVGKLQCVAALLEVGAKVDEPDGSDTTPLERAVLANEVDIARVLIARGANVNHLGKNGMTPLLYAASIDYGNAAMIELLLKSGARPDAVTKEGLTSLDLAKKYGHSHLIASLQKQVGQ
jgi:ankyrin repeat protein